MFRPCWVIFREKPSVVVTVGCTIQLSENVLLTLYKIFSFFHDVITEVDCIYLELNPHYTVCSTLHHFTPAFYRAQSPPYASLYFTFLWLYFATYIFHCLMGARSPWRLCFVWWRLSVCNLPCLTSPFWRLEYWNGPYICRKFVHPSYEYSYFPTFVTCVLFAQFIFLSTNWLIHFSTFLLLDSSALCVHHLRYVNTEDSFP
jgi:hypothetical protein